MTDPSLVPIRRPHFELRNGTLFFLISTRPFAELDPEDVELWERADGQGTVGGLREIVPDAPQRLQRLRDLGVIELAEGSFPAGRRRIVVVEPHMDDAILSVGGLMWSLRRSCEFAVVTVAGRSNFTSYWHSGRELFDPETVSELRAAESRLALRMVGGRHVALPLPEAPLRCAPGTWSRAWYDGHRKLVDASVTQAAPAALTGRWAEAIGEALGALAPDELWLPLGVGAHADHELVRNACLAVVGRARVPTPPGGIFLYRDEPYALDAPEHARRLVRTLAEQGARLEPLRSDIGPALAAKERLVSLYGSQFKPEVMLPRIRAAARAASPDGAGACEIRYELQRAPTLVEPLALYSGVERVEALRPPLAAWRERNRKAPVVRLLCAEPMPHVAHDLATLLDALPRAGLELHVRTDHLPPGARVEGDRVRLHPVPPRRRAWLVRLARLGAARRLPTLIVTGRGPVPWTPLARALFTGSDLCFAPGLGDAVLALRAHTGSGSRSGPSRTESTPVE